MAKVIRHRLFGMMAVMAASTLLVLALFWLLLQRNISVVVSAKSEESYHVAERVLDLEGRVMKGFVQNFSYWTELVDYVASGDDNWADENLDPGLVDFNCDAVWVFTTNFALVDCRIAQGAALSAEKIDVQSCRTMLAGEMFPRWFEDYDGHVYEYRAAPIHRTSDAGRSTPPQGYFVAGRAWDSEHLANLKNVFSADEVVIRLPGEQEKEADTHERPGCTVHRYGLPGVDGRDRYQMAITKCSPSIDGLIQANGFAAVATSLMIVLMVTFFTIGLTLWISVPISSVSDALEKGTPDAVAGLAEEQNEIGRLAHLVVEFFKQKTELVREIHERKEIQARQERLGVVLRTWSRVNFAMATSGSEQQLLSRVCRIVVESGSYRAAWVASVTWKSAGSATLGPMVSHGEHGGYLDYASRNFAANGLNATCVIGRAMRTKDVAVCRSIDPSRPKCEEWQKEAVARGIKVAVCFPMLQNGEVFALMGVLSDKPGDMADEEVKVLTEVVENLGAGMLLRRAEEARTVAERKSSELEDQLLRTQKLEAVGRLAGGIAHDFNNLLFVIMGNLDLVLSGHDKVPGRSELAEAMEACRQAASLTKQLLALGRRRVAAAMPVNISEEIKAAMQLVKTVLKEDVAVELKLDSRVGLILGDRLQLQQVMMNLSVNAREAMPNGGTFKISTENVCVEADFAPEAVPGDYVLVTVSDSGCGMSADVMAHIFEPFFTTKDDGTGLGLSLVQSIVNEHGGFIRVSSVKGAGTVFRVFLPIADVLPGGEAEIASMEVHRARASETVLLVEDRDMCRLLTRTMLESLGYKVVEAADPKAAISKAADIADGIDLILTDVVMPGMSGPELVVKLRDRGVAAKVVYMSGYADGVLAVHGIDGKSSGLLQKPFVLLQLAQVVRDALR